VEVPDPRLAILARIFEPRKIVPAQVEFADAAVAGGAAGSVEGALAALRDADAAVLVLRAFDNPAAPPPSGRIDPARDLAEMETSMLVADLELVERRLERVRKDAAQGRNPAEPMERRALERAASALTEGRPLREIDLPVAEERVLRGFQLASAKPLLALANVGAPEEMEPARLALAPHLAERARTALETIAARTELEILELPEADRAEFREAMMLAEGGSERVIRRAYELLGLQSFFTGGKDEVRAWTVRRGATASQAAGAIHTDLERGFIRAEVTAYDDLAADGSLAVARTRGHLRVEGKEYTVRDGDVMEIRFAV
jgi:GTP-binding protein YchF